MGSLKVDEPAGSGGANTKPLPPDTPSESEDGMLFIIIKAPHAGGFHV